MSGVYLTEHFGLLQNILPGDVLADGGFTLQDKVGMFCAGVIMPPFTREKQLTKLEVDTTRWLSHVTIHVERVIGMVWQKYTIFIDSIFSIPGIGVFHKPM